MPLLSLKNLFKIYRTKKAEIKALNGLSLDVYEGEFLIIMGTSGSGKSTLLNLIATLDTPTKGEIYYKDTNLSTLSGGQQALYRQRIVSVIFQRYNLIHNMSALFNIQLSAFIATGKRNHVDFDSLRFITDLEIEEKKHQRVENLAQGQQQRVAIARGLITNADIILADEPTGNLDSQAGETVLTLFQKINKELGKTVILTTHNTNLLKAADRVVYMKDGVVERQEIINDKSGVVTSSGNILKEKKVKNLSISSLFYLTSKILFSEKKSLLATLGAVVLGVAMLTGIVEYNLAIFDAYNPGFLASIVAKNQIGVTAEAEGYIYNVVSTIPFTHIASGRLLTSASVASIAAIPHVHDVYPVIPLDITSPYFSNYAQTATPEQYVKNTKNLLSEGSYFTSNTQNAIILSPDIANHIEQVTGKSSVIGMIVPITVTLDQYPKSSTIHVSENARIVGVLKYEFEMDPPLLPNNFDNLATPGVLPSYSMLRMELDSPANVSTVVQDLQVQGYNTVTDNSYTSFVSKTNALQLFINCMITFLAVVCMILGLVNIISVSFAGKLKSMEIFMVLGIQKTDIRKYIILESIILGIITGLLGAGLGFAITGAFEFVINNTYIPTVQLFYYHIFDFYPIIIPEIVLAAIIICFIESLYVAYKLSSSETMVSLLKRE